MLPPPKQLCRQCHASSELSLWQWGCTAHTSLLALRLCPFCVQHWDPLQRNGNALHKGSSDMFLAVCSYFSSHPLPK